MGSGIQSVHLRGWRWSLAARWFPHGCFSEESATQFGRGARSKFPGGAVPVPQPSTAGACLIALAPSRNLRYVRRADGIDRTNSDCVNKFYMPSPCDFCSRSAAADNRALSAALSRASQAVLVTSGAWPRLSASRSILPLPSARSASGSFSAKSPARVRRVSSVAISPAAARAWCNASAAQRMAIEGSFSFRDSPEHEVMKSVPIQTRAAARGGRR